MKTKSILGLVRPLLFLVCFFLTSSMYAASVQIANSTYSVKFTGTLYSSLSSITNQAVFNGTSLPNPASGSGYGVALGYFDNSFTPTTDNVASWLNNFRGYRGYWDNTPTIQASISLKFIAGPNNDPDNTGVFDNIPVGAFQSGTSIGVTDSVTQFIEGQALKLIVWGGNYSTTSPSLSTGVGIFSSPSWQIPNSYDVETPDSLVNTLFINTSTIADIGLIDNSTTGISARTIMLIPEPSTLPLLLGGISLLFLARRHRK